MSWDFMWNLRQVFSSDTILFMHVFFLVTLHHSNPHLLLLFPHRSDTGVLKLTSSSYKHSRVSYVMFDLRLESCDACCRVTWPHVVPAVGSRDWPRTGHMAKCTDHVTRRGRVTWYPRSCYTITSTHCTVRSHDMNGEVTWSPPDMHMYTIPE